MLVLIGGSNVVLDMPQVSRVGSRQEEHNLLLVQDDLRFRGRQTTEEGIADARLVPLATPTVPVPEVAAAKGAGDDSAVLGSSSPQENNRLAPRVRDGPAPDTLPYVTAPTDTYTRFFEGYRAAGGQDEARIDAMIQCESTWTIDPGGYFKGLAQFEYGTWATVSGITGYTDPYNPYHQGFNVSVWASMVSPGTSAGWPSCWWAW